MAKVDILTLPGGEEIRSVKLEGYKWGPGELSPNRDHFILSTDATIAELQSRYRIRDKKLVLLPKDEWQETIDRKQQEYDNALDDAVKDAVANEQTRFTLDAEGKLVLNQKEVSI